MQGGTTVTLTCGIRRTRRFTIGAACAALVAASLALGASAANASPVAPTIDVANTVAPSSGNVTLAWLPVSGATSYTYELSTDAGFSSILVSTTTVGLRATPESTLPSGTVYWRVAAYDGSQGAWSTSNFTRSTLAGPPLISPGANSPEVLHYPTASPVFTWSPVPGATSYTVQYSTDQFFGGTPTTATTPATSYAPTVLLTRGVSLYWRVRANVNDSPALTTEWSSNGQFSNDWPDASPTLLAPADDPSGTSPVSDIRLQWQPVPGAKSYLVDVATTPDFSVPINGSPFAVNATVYSPQRSWDNAAYYWRVRAVDPAGNYGIPSLTHQFTRSWGPDSNPTFGPSQRIAAPVTLNQSTWPIVHWDTSTSQATLTTDTPHTLPIGSSVTISGLTNTDLNGTFTVTGVPSSTTFVVSVSTTAGAADDSGSVTLPVRLEDFRLSWTAVPRASVYEVWLSKDPTFTVDSYLVKCYTPHSTLTSYDSNTILSSGAWTKFNGNCMSALTQSLNSGGTFITTTIYWRVRALDLAATDTSSQQSPGNVDASTRFIRSAWSDRDIPLTPPAITVTPPNVTGDAGNPLAVAPTLTAPTDCGNPLTCVPESDTPELVWNPLVKATGGYWVQIALDSGFSNQVAEFHTWSSRLRLDGGLLDNSASQAYYWRVMGCTSYTAMNVKTCLPSGAGNTRAFRKTGLAPAHLTSTSSGDQVQLAWDEQLLTAPNGGGTRGYQVQIASEPQFTSPVQDMAVDQPFYTTVTHLLPDGTWYWRVRAIDGNAANLPWSSTANFSKTADRPATAQATNGPAAPALTWTSVPGTATYDIEIYSGNNLSVGGALVKAASGIQATAYTFNQNALPPGPYSWRVRRHDSDVNTLTWTAEPGGNPAQFSVSLDALTPTSPADNAELQLNERVLTWSASAGAVRYRIQTADNASFNPTIETVETVQTTAALKSALYQPVSVYYWRVQALNGSGTVLSTTDYRHFSTLSTPSNVGSVSLTPSTFSLQAQWTAPSNEGGRPVLSYTVRWRQSSIATWSSQVVSATSPKALTINGLLSYTQYEVQVAATNAIGTGPYSGSYMFTSKDTTPPTAAMVLPAAGGTLTLSTSISIKWSGTDNAGISSYQLQRAVKVPGTWLGTFTNWGAPITPTSVTMTGARPGYAYCFHVQSIDTSGNLSPWTTSRCTTVPLDERSLVRRGAWTASTSAGAFMHTLLTSRSAGATASLAQVRGSAIAIVFRKSPGGGTFGVYSGTRRIGGVNTAATRTIQQSVLRIAYPTAGNTIVVKVERAGSSGVTLDGFAQLN